MMKSAIRNSCCLVWAAFFLSACAQIHFVEFESRPPKSPSFNHAEHPKTIDILNTQLDLSFNWDSALVYGKAIIQAQPYSEVQNRVILDAKGFKIKKVELLKDEHPEGLFYTYQNNELIISLDKSYQPQEHFTISISYIAAPDQLTVGQDIRTKNDRGLYFITKKGGHSPQLWTQGETNCNSAWFPTIDDPAEKMTQSVNLTVGDQFKTLSNGMLTGSIANHDGTRTDHWEMKQPHSTYLAMIAVGNFSITEDHYKNIPLHYYLEPKFAPFAKDLFGHTPQMMEFFSDTLHYPFVWPKYDQVVVNDFVSGAMENTTASVFYDRLNKTTGALKDEHEDAIIAHELFHHWFGDLVTAKSWSDLALHESFATYAEYLWLRHQFGEAVGKMNLIQDAEDYFSSRKNKGDASLIRVNYAHPDDLFDAVTYQKGALILDMLRTQVGDPDFFGALHQYLEKYAFKTADAYDLKRTFEEVSHQDLSWFFEQWFFNSSNPLLKIKKSYEEDAKILTITVDQVLDRGHTHLFRLPVKVKVVDRNGQEDRLNLEVHQQHQQFSFPLKVKPLYVKFDTDQQLLIEKQEDKNKDDYRYQYLFAVDFLDRYQSVKYFQKHGKSIYADEIMIKALNTSESPLISMALNYMKGMKKKEQSVHLERIRALAMNSQDTRVQAMAIKILQKLEDEEHKVQLYQYLKNDPSLLVQKAIKRLI